jgi:predicted membrane chloride channel (bestrophin family)
MWDVSPVYIHMIGVFFVTYSFVGIELLSIELDDPFGPDANDFDNIPMAQTVFEDCYAIIDMVDGPAWASRLRMNMNDETEPPAPAEIDYKF